MTIEKLTSDKTPDSDFRDKLFELYMDRQNSIESFKNLSRTLMVLAIAGGLAVAGGHAEGGLMGGGMITASVIADLINEIRLAKLQDKISDEHQDLIKAVYDYKDRK